MILDKRIQLATAATLNLGAAGSYIIGDSIDLGSAGRDVGNGEEMGIVFQVNTTCTSGGGATLAVNLMSDTVSTMTGTPVVMLATPTFAVASLVAGTVLYAGYLPLEGTVYKQFLGIQQVTGVAAFTAGAIDVFMVDDISKWKAYLSKTN